MHYDNPACVGLITVGPPGQGRTVFNNFHYHAKDTLIFNYQPGDVLSISESETCIVHLYSLDAMNDPDVAGCDVGAGQGDCWTWAADLSTAQSCQDSISGIMDQINTVCCPQGNCAGFPADCNDECAALWTPVWEPCANTISQMFQADPTLRSTLRPFSTACEATRSGGTTTCSDEYFQDGQQAIATSCNRGQPGVPTKCSRSCAAVFQSFYAQCSDRLDASYQAFSAVCERVTGGGH